ncbi:MULTISPECIES: bactofilin family protein [unclassified Novosphingobium]|uniref:bactofilin family protein n=1 Tax=Novosphingobium TaxID=165696 RepID=UPI0014472327|nr:MULTISPECIES: polymer-forming cytoskeletal protein [unclassified Novosphingobium]NKJ42698.1 cytoskeletal protein CcmA (bactofilin family) [Novosphingobium sp. SG720]NMN05665.1 cytoskeletal protein CcmA (bactofilin family) [Novosphingobium sp. SG919]NMN87975.1 cytoskeletal protein CcmA (bactofilin family) [Novosphingobium sp. SG916]
MTTPDRAPATFSVLGADLAVRGDITAEADLHIDGKIEGDVACAALVQGESSVITGAITARNARLAGTVNGAVSVADLVITRTARIVGDVGYDTLTIEQGARVEGRFAPRGANAAAAVPDSLIAVRTSA